MKKYIIEQANVGEVKEGEKNGRKWKGTKCGVKIGGKWYNNWLFSDWQVDIIAKANGGDELYLELFKEEYNGKEYDKFKIPSKVDILEKRVEILEFLINGKGEDPEPDPPEEAEEIDPLEATWRPF